MEYVCVRVRAFVFMFSCVCCYALPSAVYVYALSESVSRMRGMRGSDLSSAPRSRNLLSLVVHCVAQSRFFCARAAPV